jgi:hypothetical protein
MLGAWLNTAHPSLGVDLNQAIHSRKVDYLE